MEKQKKMIFTKRELREKSLSELHDLMLKSLGWSQALHYLFETKKIFKNEDDIRFILDLMTYQTDLNYKLLLLSSEKKIEEDSKKPDDGISFTKLLQDFENKKEQQVIDNH